MAETHQEVVKVWIAPGCIVCDSCETDCPEVFDVQEETCVIKPPAAKSDFLQPLTPSIIVAAEGCPVDVIKFETKEVEGPKPWPDEPVAAPAGAAAGHAPVAKAPAAVAPPDPKWQALLSTSRISPSLSAGLSSTMRKSPELNKTDEVVRMMKAEKIPMAKDVSANWKDLPPDYRMAVLSAGGAFQPAPSLADRLRNRASEAGKVSRRSFNLALAVGWGGLAFATATFGAMFQDFFGPKALKEPKKVYRLGRPADFANPGVYEQFRGIEVFVVNLQPGESKIVALSTICTHLGCIPDWKPGDLKFKCPCHGSGYYINGINFEGPTPRPLERHAVYRDPDGYVVVDKSKVYRQELGEWDNPESYVTI